jgi:hypothetical protein
MEVPGQKTTLFGMMKPTQEFGTTGKSNLFGSRLVGKTTTTTTTTTTSENLFSQVAGSSSLPPPTPSNLFGTLIGMTKAQSAAAPPSLFAPASKTQPPQSLFAKPAAVPQQAQPPATSLFGARFEPSTVKPQPSSENAPQNLFGSLLFKKQETPPTVAPSSGFMSQSRETSLAKATTAAAAAAAPKTAMFNQQENHREKLLDQVCDSTFQSLYLELVRDMSRDLLFKLQTVSTDLMEQLVREGVGELTRRTVHEQVQQSRDERISMARFNAIDRAACGLFDELLDDLTSQTCTDLVYNFSELEFWILDEMTNSVFQREFELVIKQIAFEINREMRLDQLAEGVYFNFGEKLCDAAVAVSNDLVIEVANLNK